MQYITDIKPYFKQKLPKKIVVSRRIRVTAKYHCQVTFWIPDIPYSKNAPGIGMTIRHGQGDQKEFLRLVFSDSRDLENFISELGMFVLDVFNNLKDEHLKAMIEWESYRLKVNEHKESKVHNEKMAIS